MGKDQEGPWVLVGLARSVPSNRSLLLSSRSVCVGLISFSFYLISGLLSTFVALSPFLLFLLSSFPSPVLSSLYID
jgi:hypothetical protein